MRGTATRLAVAAVAAALFLAASPPALADTTIDFEGPSAGSTLTTYYSGQGVTFGPLPGNVGDSARPTVQSVGSQAHSGSQVANINCPTCNEGLGYTPDTTGTFSSAHAHISVYVGLLGSSGFCTTSGTGACADVTLIAYDSDGTQVGTSGPVRVFAGSGVGTQLSVTRPTPEIVGFEVKAADKDSNKNVAIDDLSFDTPVTPPPPDFTLTAQHTDVKVAQGGSQPDQININRISGSTGNVSLSATGLPPGVHAQFSPNPAGGSTSTLTLTADPDAPRTSGPDVPITITATPQDSSAGTKTHSLTVHVGVVSAFDMHVEGGTDIDLSACTVQRRVVVFLNGGFSGPVSLSITGLPGGVHASFAPDQVTQSTSYSVLTLSTQPTGFPTLRRTATIHASAPGYPERTANITVGGTCSPQFDPRVTGMQITQGVQSPTIPTWLDGPSQYTSTPGGYAILHGGGPTVVRVYADLASGPPTGIPDVPMVLNGTGYAGHKLAGSPILPISAPPVLKPGLGEPTDDQKKDELGAYTFVLPPSWTHGTITLTAQLLPVQSGGQPVARAHPAVHAAAAPGATSPIWVPCLTPGYCLDNDKQALHQIEFNEARSVTIRPIAMTVGGAALPDPSSVFARARVVTPLGVIVEPYAGTIDITGISDPNALCTAYRRFFPSFDCSNIGDLQNELANNLVDDWTCDNGAPGFGWDIGVNTGVARGRTNFGDICWEEFNAYKDAVIEYQRPITSVAHEFFHLLGRAHASYGCHGGDNGQSAESWPDPTGHTHSVGLDTILGSGKRGPFALPSTPPDKWFDFMSYCASSDDSNAWGSVRNWNKVFQDNSQAGARVVEPRLAAAGSRRRSLLVHAYLNHDGTALIGSVAPVDARPQPPGNSAFRLIGFNAAGEQIADVHMLRSLVHVDHAIAPITLEGVIPAAGVVRVAILNNGSTLTSRHASAHRPTVKLLGVPRVRGRTAKIRWRSADADRDPLQAVIDYSSDGGRHFRQIWAGASHGLARVPSYYLSRSANARVRVTVNDGFWSAAATSRRFHAPGSAPVVTILSPKRGFRIRNDASLLLVGQAFDDRLDVLSGRLLRWMLGRRLLGTGSQISVAGLPAGRHRIKLLARDIFGRVGSASVVVNLRATRPLFVTLRVPGKVSRKAHRLSLKVASSLSAKLAVRIAKKSLGSFRVDRKLRRLSIHIPTGRKTLKLKLTLRSAGLHTTVAVAVRRR